MPIFFSNFLGILSGGLSDSIYSLLLSLLLSMVIVFFYHRTNRGFSFENSFAFTLVMISVIVTTVMATISSSIALSLGLIGSLSIIRFRTSIKNSVDMAFIFWSIALGLACGARNYEIAVLSTVIISGAVAVFNKWGIFLKSNTDYILVVHFKNLGRQQEVAVILNRYALAWKIKSSHSSENDSEVTYSIHSRNQVHVEQVTEDVMKLDGIINVSLLTPETNLFV